MAEALRTLARDRIGSRRHLADARRRASEVFSIEEMARRYARCLSLRITD